VWFGNKINDIVGQVKTKLSQDAKEQGLIRTELKEPTALGQA
jgi:hypothetical protein